MRETRVSLENNKLVIYMCGGSGGNKSGGGGGSSEPTNYTVESAEFVKPDKPFGMGFDLVKVKSGQYTYSEGREISSYGKAISEGRINVQDKDVWGDLKYFKTREEAISTAKKEFKRSY